MTHDFLEHVTKAIDHLQRELQGIRTGRANPSIVEDLSVLAYGTPTPLQQLAAISAPEPRLIVVQPWDASLVKDIEKALSQSPLGINPVVDGKIIRLPFPAMTEERRHELQKVVNEKGEEGRVRVRGIREDVIKELRKNQKEGTMSEDSLEAELKKLQADVTATLEHIETIVKQKTEELSVI